MEFNIIGQTVKANLGSRCYSNGAGNNDICEIYLNTIISGINIPIVPTQTV
jgi:hypothetical protein